MVIEKLEGYLNAKLGSSITVKVNLGKKLGCSDIQDSASENDGVVLLKKTASGDFIFTAIDTDEELACVDDIAWVSLVVETVIG